MAKWSDFETHPVGTADRIKELEAKLAECEARLEKSVEALALADAALSGANMDMNVVERKMKATIAKLKGQDDE